MSRFAAALAAAGLEADIREFPEGTRTAEQAAAAVGCDVAQICKSLVFRLEPGGEAALVIASGANRVDTGAVGALLGGTLEKADAAFVRERTGYAIGGVPPLGHATPLRTVIDRDLLAFPEVWAAAGTPRAVFGVSPQRLVEATGATVAAVAG